MSLKAVKIHVFDYPHCCLTPPLQGTPSNIGKNLILPETTVIGSHRRSWKCGCIFIQIFTVSSERRTCFETEFKFILAPIESKYQSKLVVSSNLSPILSRFTDIKAFVCRKPLFPYPSPIPAKISGCSPWSRCVLLWSAESEHHRLTNREIIFEDFQPMWLRYLNVTDGRTDRRTDNLPWQYRALCSIAR